MANRTTRSPYGVEHGAVEMPVAKAMRSVLLETWRASRPAQPTFDGWSSTD